MGEGTPFAEARDRVAKAHAAVENAQNAAAAAVAELIRQRIVDVADREPSITAVGFDLEYCYDDEGGYYDQVTISTIGTEDGWNDELYDLGCELDKLSGAVLCGGRWADVITVESLRGARF